MKAKHLFFLDKKSFNTRNSALNVREGDPITPSELIQTLDSPSHVTAQDWALEDTFHTHGPRADPEGTLSDNRTERKRSHRGRQRRATPKLRPGPRVGRRDRGPGSPSPSDSRLWVSFPDALRTGSRRPEGSLTPSAFASAQRVAPSPSHTKPHLLRVCSTARDT